MSITVNSVAEDWSVHDLSIANRSAFTRPAHEANEPALVIFSRVLPKPTDGDPGQLTGRFKIVSGDLDANGDPCERNGLIEVTYKVPLDHGADVITDQQHVLDAIVAHSTLVPNLLKGVLPMSDI